MARQLALRRVAVVLGALCLVLAAWYLAVRPTMLRVAVGPPGSAQVEVMEALARVLRDTHQPFRLRLVRAGGTADASRMLDKGTVDLAVLRSDDHEGRDARSIVILHKRALAVVLRKDSGIETLRDIADRPIGITNVDSDSYRPIVQRIMSHFELDEAALKLQEMTSKETVDAMAQRRIDGFVMVINPASKPTRDMIAEITGKHKQEIVVKGVPSHQALELRFQELHKSAIPEGAFGLQPAKEEDTVGITLEIVGSSRLSEQTATELTKSLMEVRGRLRSAQALTYNIETPPVDEDRRFLPHAGTAAFVNSEAKTLLEQYSDYIWLGLFSAGIIGSSVAGLMSWAGFKSEATGDTLAEQVRVLAGRLEAATTTAEIDNIQGDFDDVVLAIMRDYGLRGLADGGAPDPSPWFNTFAGLIERRRRLLEGISPATTADMPGRTTVKA
jgi:TRAP-type uncharacterized transport system substrate-binding protein